MASTKAAKPTKGKTTQVHQSTSIPGDPLGQALQPHNAKPSAPAPAVQTESSEHRRYRGWVRTLSHRTWRAALARSTSFIGSGKLRSGLRHGTQATGVVRRPGLTTSRIRGVTTPDESSLTRRSDAPFAPVSADASNPLRTRRMVRAESRDDRA